MAWKMNRRFGMERRFNSFDVPSFTLFVDYLPHDVGPKWFRSFFSNFGVIKRSFIPYKVSRRSGYRFGFVTFGNRKEAELAIAKSNGLWIDNRSLLVKMASFSLNPHPLSTQIPNPQPTQSQPCSHSKPFTFNHQFSNPQVFSNHQPQHTSNPKSYAEILNTSSEKRITIKVRPIASSWLSNCAVVKLKNPSTPEMIMNALLTAGIYNVEVKSMGGLYMLFIFISKDERNNALSNPTLKEWFAYFKPWNGEPASMSRFVWLKCRGVPIQAWNASTFKRIGESWGDFINLDEETMRELSYDIGRMLITTDYELPFDEWINILINGINYRVRVWEEPCDDPFAVIFKTLVNIGVQTGASLDSMSHSQDKNNNFSYGDNLEGVKDLLTGDLVELEQADLEGVKDSPTAKPAELDAQSDTVKDGHYVRALSTQMQGDSLALALASNFSLDLESIVEDSEDQAIGSKAHLSERVNQEISYKNSGRKTLCLDGPIVIGSDNGIRASQLPTINLQVDLNPKDARKALRKRIRESSMSQEASEYVENTINFVSQGQKHDPILSELYATTKVGDKLGIALSNEDVLDLENMILSENRFAPLQRSNPL